MESKPMRTRSMELEPDEMASSSSSSSSNLANEEESHRNEFTPDSKPGVNVKKECTGDRVGGSWYWLLAPDGTPATVEAASSRTRTARPDAIPSAGGEERMERDEKPGVTKPPRGQIQERGSWCWLLAPDGSPSIVEPPAAGARATRKRRRRTPATGATRKRLRPARISYAESDIENEDSDIDVDCTNEIADEDRNRYTTAERAQWEAKYRLLVKYKTEHGTTMVPTTDPTIGRWIGRQRVIYSENMISQYRRQRLDAIGFSWNVHEDNWTKMFGHLVAYKNKHGTTRVPDYGEALGTWVATQRASYRRQKLSKRRFELLESVGLEWKIVVPWMEMYKRLRSYKKKHKNCRVPSTFKEDPKLGRWVCQQRYECKDKDRIDLLNKIGFDWKPVQDDWTRMYQRLVAYKKKHGTTHVPRGSKDSKLERWVSKQRFRCKQQHRIDLLNDISFAWRVK